MTFDCASIKLKLQMIRHGSFVQLLQYVMCVVYLILLVCVTSFLINTLTQGISPLVLEFEQQVVPGLGEGGKPASLPSEQSHSELEFEVIEQSYNKFISDRISLKRKLPDIRNKDCAAKNYNINQLPKASVIIIFCNESMSAVMRTVWSVIEQTPLKLLHQIILIDDGSGSEEMVTLLPLYVQHRLSGYNVQLHRYEQNNGLVVARQKGVAYATGDILVFLDSHCEVTPGWLQPLSQHIKVSPNAVAIPVIDGIDPRTLEFQGAAENVPQVGGFTWSGHFTWEVYKGETKKKSEPLPSPTMSGGIFAIGRNYFWDIGGYDLGMTGWGGENLEMSFRVWQCGGRIDVVPCSHVGHIFRPSHPYVIPKDSHGKNTRRVVEVWMDDYKRLFYLHRKDLADQDPLKDIRHRLDLKKTTSVSLI